MSTSFADTHKAVAVIFDGWNQADAVMFAENQPEKPPTDKTWMRWSLRPADTLPVTCDGAFERTVGLVYVQIFTPIAEGTRAAHAMADKLKALFNEKRVTNASGGVIVFQHVRLEYVSRDANGWTQHNAILAYSEDGRSVLAA
jgi:hypothetical protein